MFDFELASGLAVVTPRVGDYTSSDIALRMGWSADRLLGCPFKIEGKGQRGLEPLHYHCGQLANLALKTHRRWLLIHDPGMEAAVVALHMDCLFAG